MGLKKTSFLRVRLDALFLKQQLFEDIEFARADRVEEAGMREILRTATGSVCIAMYAFTLPGIAAILTKLHQKATPVNVRVVYDERWSLSNEEALEIIIKLLEAEIPVKNFRSISMHFKMVIVGGLWCAVGSPNLTRRAYRSNVECLVKVHGPKNTAKVSSLFDELFDDPRARPAKLYFVRKQLDRLRKRQQESLKGERCQTCGGKPRVHRPWSST